MRFNLVRKPSFRLRISLLSSLFVSVALVSFGSISWWLIYQEKLNRIDDGIKNQLIREADRPHPPSHWQIYDRILPTIFNTDTANLALLVQTPTGETVDRTPTWTAELTRHTVFVSIDTALPAAEFPPPNQRQTPSAQTPPPNRPPHQPIVKLTSIGTWRVGMIASPHTRLAIAVSLQTIEPEMNGIRNAYLVSIPILLVSIEIGALWLCRCALQPIRGLTETLRQVTVDGLDRRVSVDGIDCEFVELLAVFNQMMARLERSFTQASRFSADAAHELKTPLSILQGELERNLQAADPGSELQQSLSSLLDEVRHLSTIVRKLLLLSLADAGQMRVYKTEVNLSELLIDLASDIELISPDLTVQLQIETNLNIQADRPFLIQVLQNLIGNAIKYNLPSGWVRIEAEQRDRLVSVRIANRSSDIPASDRSALFDRFYRGDPARTKQVEGLGLGLSLAREIVYAHGGDLTLDDTPDGQTAFTLTLPIQS
jgi:two-component system, OmpR family, heavy metal sensor histidine kinase CusS